MIVGRSKYVVRKNVTSILLNTEGETCPIPPRTRLLTSWRIWTRTQRAQVQSFIIYENKAKVLTTNNKKGSGKLCLCWQVTIGSESGRS